MAVRSVEYIISLRDNFSKNLSGINKNLRVTGQKIQSIGKTMSLAVTLPIVALGATAVKLASDFEETESKFFTVFSSIQKQAAATSKNLKDNFGLSSRAALQLLGDTGDLLVGFGFTESAALEMSQQVNELAVDLASFTNVQGGAKSASAALTKALLGERESIKTLGISILESDVKARVLLNTQKGLRFESVRQAKAVATLQLATEQSSKAIGDFERTSQSFANQMRITRARLEDLGIQIGKVLLPTALKFLKIIKGWIEGFSQLSPATKKTIVIIGGLVAILGPLLLILGTLIGTILPALATGFVFLTGPIGLIIVGIAALVAGIVAFRRSANKMTEVQRRLNAINQKVTLSIRDEKEKLGFLFNQLKQTNPQTELRRKIIKKINDQYPELLSNIDLEKAGLNEIEIAYNSVVKAIENKVRAQILEQELTKVINELREVNLKLLDRDRTESIKLLKRQQDVLRTTKNRINSEIKLQNITVTFGEAAAKIFKEREKLIGDLIVAEAVLFRSEEEDDIAFALRQKNRLQSIKTIEAEIKALDKRRKMLIETGDAGKKAGIVPGAITGPTTKIISAAPKIFNITIENLVETINNNVTNLKEGMNESKKIITEALLTALSDTQVLVR